MTRAKVLVADAERSFAQALAFRLSQEATLNVIGSVYSAATAEAEAARAHPDVVVLGEMVGEEIVALTRRFASVDFNMHVVTMLSSEDPRRACDLVRAGACAVVVKDSEIDDVVTAVGGARRDESHIPPRLLTSVLNDLCAGEREWEEDERLARLTPRERDVLACLMAGLDRARIAERMVLSTNTVRTHTQNVFAKLDVHSTLEAVSVALRAGFSERPRAPESMPPRQPARRIGPRERPSVSGGRR